MADRSKLAAKISALRAKTTDAGCTEAEALAAAELAARLMAEHGFDEAEIEMVSATARETTSRATWRSVLAASITIVTNTGAIRIRHEMEFVGRDPGPEIAAYLYAVLVRAVERAASEFKATSEYKRRRTLSTRRKAVADFITAMVHRLHGRLRDLFATTISKDARSSAQAVLDARYPRARSWAQKPTKERFSDAGAAGRRVGEKVTLAHGVAGSAVSPLAITGGVDG